MSDWNRRDFLKGVGALGLCALPGRSMSDDARSNVPAGICTSGGASSPLHIPGNGGFLGRLAVTDDTLTLRASAPPAGVVWPEGLTLGYRAQVRGVDYLDPTLVVRADQRMRIELVNGIDAPTIVHWHGLAVDTRNDGGGMTLAAPSERYAYDFTLRNRGALYWYHPHPHGLTAGQAYRGMFGMLEVTDADEERLRSALDLVPGRTEIPLVLQDRRAEADYAASEHDRVHGWLGNRVLVNGTECPHLDAGTCIYRFRVLNASNARTYRLSWRTADGKPFPFTVIGNDGGLLPAPRSCADAFLATAERLDLLLDLSDLAAGDALVLETLAFDPMAMKMAGDAGAEREAAGAAFPEGVRRALLTLRVREKTSYAARIPAQLSPLPSIDIGQAVERPLRLGFAKGRWRINDRVFAMGETPIEVKRDSVEVWLIRNYFNSMPHAMHLHGFAFEVLERQTSPDPIAALKVDDKGRLATDGGRKDTVLVWPGESVRLAVNFACPFPGDQVYMLHCHNLEHEDGGMMLGVKLS